MPEKKTVERAKQDLKAGKSASTAAGEFVHEEIDHIREGKHGARSTKQAIAIGLSKARRAGVPLAPPKSGQASERTRRSAQRDTEVGDGTRTRRRSARGCSSSWTGRVGQAVGGSGQVQSSIVQKVAAKRVSAARRLQFASQPLSASQSRGQRKSVISRASGEPGSARHS